MTERSLEFLDEFLDTIVALPHDVQRLLTLLKEKDAFTHGIEEGISATAAYLSENPKLDGAKVKTSLTNMENRLALAAAAAEEKVSIARHMHELVVHHLKRMEDEVCLFEEELRVARNFGDLDDANDGEDEEGGEEGSGNNSGDSNVREDAEGGVRTDAEGRGRTKDRATERRKNNKRRSMDESSNIPPDPTKGNRPESPRRADFSEFDQIPTTTMGGGGGGNVVDRPSKRSRRSQDQSSEPSFELENSFQQTTAPVFSALEPTYCYCNQVSFGEMIGCDNPSCDIEWFHYGCVGLSAPPPGKWYCPDCAARLAKDYTKSLPSEILTAADAATASFSGRRTRKTPTDN